MGGHMADTKKRIAQAEARARQAELRAQQAKARIEQAQTRIEQAETRAEQAETHAEQVKTILHEVIQSPVIDLPPAVSRKLLHDSPTNGATEQKKLLEQLTPRQREILRLIAEGQSTKQIGGKLKLSPKTVEYHRKRLMTALNLHDVQALVRFAVLVGLISPEA